MRLTGDAARKWLAENPGAAYVDNKANRSYDRERGALEKIFMGITKPFRQGAGVAEEFRYTLSDLIRGMRGEREMERPDKYALLSQEESEQLYRDPLQTGLKSAAGIMSYAVPGGSTASTIGGRIAGAAGKGAVSGGLGAFSASDEGEELESILKGAGLGGLIGGGLQAGGEGIRALKNLNLSKQAEKLGKTADKMEVNAYTKKIGTKPTMKQGKYDLARDSLGIAKLEGKTINSADELSNFSDELFAKYGDTANQYAQTFDQIGGSIDVNDIKQPLLEKLGTTQTPELRAPIEKVINSIDEATAGAQTLSAQDVLNLRREWGNLGNWNQFTPASEKAVANAWELVYNNTNDVLDNAFKGVGLDDFVGTNKILKTAIDQQNWARKAVASRSGAPVWTDMTQDAAMFGNMLAGGPGAVATTLSSKFLQKEGEGIASRGLRGVSNALQGVQETGIDALSNILGTTGQAVQRVAPAMAGQATQIPGLEQQTTQQQVQPQMQTGLSDEEMALRMQFANAIYQGQITVDEAQAIEQLLGIDLGFGSMGNGDLSANQSKSIALQQSLDNLRSAWESTSGIGKLSETLGINVGGARSLDQAKAAVVEDLGRLQSQGAINADERKAFESMMPNSWDSAEVVEQKLQAIQNRINAYL